MPENLIPETGKDVVRDLPDVSDGANYLDTKVEEVNVKCEICGGNHYHSHCGYRVRIPANTDTSGIDPFKFCLACTGCQKYYVCGDAIPCCPGTPAKIVDAFFPKPWTQKVSSSPSATKYPHLVRPGGGAYLYPPIQYNDNCDPWTYLEKMKLKEESSSSATKYPHLVRPDLDTKAEEVNEKCEICGGNHYHSCCGYRVHIPANTDTSGIDSSKFRLVCTRCHHYYVDGKCSDIIPCRPGTPAKIIDAFYLKSKYDDVGWIPPQLISSAPYTAKHPHLIGPGGGAFLYPPIQYNDNCDPWTYLEKMKLREKSSL